MRFSLGSVVETTCKNHSVLRGRVVGYDSPLNAVVDVEGRNRMVLPVKQLQLSRTTLPSRLPGRHGQ